MANFIVNSVGTKAIKISTILGVSIDPIHPQGPCGNQTIDGYNLVLTLDYGQGGRIAFETATTDGEIRALAAPVMAALES
jgi:hypothetical protein